jgi:hypothetical protein
MTHSAEYAVLDGMKQRCYDRNCRAYKDYGGRGITVCDEWLRDFMNFYRDMGPKQDGMTIERIDNSKGYTKDNCRWATPKEQSRNRRSNVWVEAFGKRKIVADWAAETGIPDPSIRNALKRGENLEAYLTQRGVDGSR